MRNISIVLFFLPSIALAQLSPSEGFLGAVAPQYGNQCAAQDPTGKLQALTVDGSGALVVNATITIPAIGPNNTPIPTSSMLVGGSDGTDLRPLKTDATGILQTAVTSSALPTGAATAANQTGGNQKTQVVDGSGNVIASTANALNAYLTNATLAVTQSGTWNINDISGTVSLPTGASTSANQTNGTQKTRLTDGTNDVGVKQLSSALVATDYGLITNTAIHGLSSGGGGTYVDVKVTPSGALTVALGDISSVVGQATMANSLPVVLASNQSAIPVTQSGTWNVGLSAGTNLVGKVGIDQTTPGTTNGVSLAFVNSTAVATGNGVAGAGVQRVTIASDNTAFSVNAAQSGTWTVQPGNTANTTAWLVTQDGRAKANAPAYNDYASANVTTSAYTQLVASLTSGASEVEIFDSSGQGMILATGAAGAETDQVYIFPGGNGRIPLKIAAGTRVAIKAKTANATSGYIMVNFYN